MVSLRPPTRPDLPAVQYSSAPIFVYLRKCQVDGGGGGEHVVVFQDLERMGDVLKSLGNVDVTLAILRESKVGATVSKLKKHSDEGVSNSAKALIKKWKKVAEASGVQGGTAAASPAGKSEKSKPAPVSAEKGIYSSTAVART